jgi:hypothetical protein
MRYPNTGTGEGGKSSLKFFSLEDREEKTIMDGVDGYEASADGKKKSS